MRPARRGVSKVVILVPIGVVLLVLVVGGLIAVLVGVVAGPAITAVREAAVTADELRSQTVVMELALASGSARNEFPEQKITIDLLLEQNYVLEEIMRSPFGPVSDGGDDFWLHPSPAAPESIADPSLYVVAYDRAMYERHPQVSVAYLDGSSRVLEVAELDARLGAGPNGGTEYDLPTRP